MIEKWEAYMLPKHSSFAPIAEGHLQEGTQLLPALEKVNSVYLRVDIQKNCRQFLNELVSTILTTVGARSLVGQGLSYF